jgi:hypothetical protein
MRGKMNSLITIHSWLYTLIVAMDTNFWVKSRLHGAINREPTLGLGWSYFVDNRPYLDFIKDYVDQDEARIFSKYIFYERCSHLL